MNKNFYKTIFSKTRGEMIAVAENVSTAGQTSTTNNKTVDIKTKDVISIKSLGFKVLSFSLMLITGTALISSPLESLQANVVADPNAAGNQRPIILNSANGTPQVDIQTPSQAGVSMNHYQQFDVSQKGVILNNSRQNTQTQLGGYIQANPWLASGEAKVIVNQVNSSNPSHLNGYVEVGGRKADVIIANQAGINVDGGGFINAGGVTLTTANPNLQNGQVTNYHVREGQVNITGQGLDASTTDYTQILSRTAQVNAGIWAKDLAVITGQNDIATTQQQINGVSSASIATGITPKIAIDTGNLGGMYAGKINLISTDKGVGINNAGQIFASAGNIKISANGEVLNSGAVVAQDINNPNQATLDIQATDLNNSGSLSSLGQQTLRTNTIKNSGLITTSTELNIRNTGSLYNQGELNAGRIDIESKTLINQSGKIVQTGLQDLVIDSKTLSNKNKGLIGYAELEQDTGSGSGSNTDTETKPEVPSTAIGGGSTSSANTSSTISFAQGKIKADSIENDAGKIISNGAGVSLNLVNGLDNQNAKISVNHLNVSGEKFNNVDGVVQAEKSQIKTRIIDNTRGEVKVKQTLTMQSDVLTNNNGSILSIQELDIQSKKIESVRGKIQSGDKLIIRSDDLNNTEGEITADKTLTIQTKKLNTNSGKIQSADHLTINTDDLSNVAGMITTNRDLSIESKSLNNNKGKIQSGNNLNIQSDDLQNIEGEIVANHSLNLTSKTVNNTKGKLQSNENLSINSTDLINQDGNITTNQELDIRTESLNNSNGSIQAADHLTIDTNDLNNVSGTITTNRDLNIESKNLNSNKGKIHSGNNLNIQSDSVKNIEGEIVANHSLNITSESLDSTKGTIQSNDNLSITSTELINQSGQITAVGTADIQSQQLNNAQGKIQAGEKLSIQSQYVNNTEAEIFANSTLNITSETLDSTKGKIQGNENLNITSTDLINQSGQITAVGTVDIQSQKLNNTQGKMITGDKLSVQSQHLNNVEGEIFANSDLNIISPQMDSTKGKIQSGERLSIQTTDLENKQGQIAAKDIFLDVQTVNNNSGEIYSSQTLIANIADHLNNESGQISSAKDIQIYDAQRNQLKIDNTENGKILANNHINIQAKQLENTGELSSGQDLKIELSDEFNLAADLNAGGNLIISSQQDIINTKKLVAGKQVKLTAKQLDNQSEGVIQGEQSVNIESKQMTNRGLINSDGLTHIKVEEELNNIGTGRIYGDHVAIESQEIINQQELLDIGEKSAVIAARQRLDIAAKNIMNQESSLISSLGDLAIGGELNSQLQAQGQADRLINASARIESQANANISVKDLQNLNNHLEVEEYWVGDKLVKKWKNPADPDSGILFIDQDLSSVTVGSKRSYFYYLDGRVIGVSYGGHNYGMYNWEYIESEYDERIKNSKPGEIIIGGDLKISGDHWLNEDSQILVGGTLFGNDASLIENKETLANARVEKVGKMKQFYYGGNRRVGSNTSAYNEIEKSTHQFEQPAMLFETERAETQISDKTEKTNLSAIQPDIALDNTDVTAEKANVNTSQKGITTGNATINTTTIKNGQIKIQGQQTIQLPNSSLFNTNPNNPKYLIETDPAFTNNKKWLGSDYMLQMFNTDPQNSHKFLGDGYYEQRLINDQIAKLTGYRRLEGYQNDEEQFKALMNSGITAAKSINLTVGIALSAEQVARLTSDMVWLVNETVTLADGTQQNVLVPKVYLMVRKGDLKPTGALITANAVDLQNSQDIINQGTIAGRQLVNFSADNIHNSGLIQAKSVKLVAQDKIQFEGGVAKAEDYLGLSADRIELNTTTQTTGDARNGNTTVDRIAGLYVTGEQDGILAVEGKKGIDAKGVIISNTSTDGKTQLRATEGSINIGTVDIARHESYGEKSDKTHYLDHEMAEVGTIINTAGNASILAHDKVDIRQGMINSDDGKVSIYGESGVNITEGRAISDLDTSVYSKTKGFLSSSTSLVQKQNATDQSVSSVITGNEVSIGSGEDLNIRGSQVVANQDVNLSAKKNVNIEAAQDQSANSTFVQNTQSGFTGSLSGGVASIGYGKSNTKQENQSQSTSLTQSVVGSVGGNTNIVAGENLTATASIIESSKDINLVGKNVYLDADYVTDDTQARYEHKSSGVSIGVTYNSTAAAASAKKSQENNDFSDSAVGKIMSSAETIRKASMAATTPVVIQAQKQNITQTQNSASSQVVGTEVKAGGNLNIIATDGDIRSQAAKISAEGDALLYAKNNIELLAGQNTENQIADSKRSGFSIDTRDHVAPLGVYNDKEKANGGFVQSVGTEISIGGKTTLQAKEGDINIVGSTVVSQDDLTLYAGKDVNIRSAQNSFNQNEDKKSTGWGSAQISDTERFDGYMASKDNASSESISQVRSQVGSLDGYVNIIAGNNYNQKVADVVASKDINIIAKKIEIIDDYNTGSDSQSSKDLKIGAFSKVSSPLIDLVNAVDQASNSKANDRTKALQGLAAGAQAYQTANTINDVRDDIAKLAANPNATDLSNAALFKAETGIGFSKSKNNQDNRYSISQGNVLNAGGDVNLISTEGDIHLKNTQVNAKDQISLDSAKNILLESGQSTEYVNGKNSNIGASVGVGASVGAQTGVYIYAEAGYGQGSNHSESTTHQDTTLNASRMSIKSKGDTTLHGAQAIANRIDTDIGGKLSIISSQDTQTQNIDQTGIGARVQASIGTAWQASGNVNNSQASGSSQHVNQQSGLFAGDGGYHVKADSVDLQGGAIVSTASKENNDLTTNSFTFSDIKNSSSYEATSVTLSGGTKFGTESGTDNAGNKYTNNVNWRENTTFSPTLPQQSKDNDSSTTYATLSVGNITIGGKETSVEELGIHSDINTANIKVDEVPDLHTILEQQKIVSDATSTIVAATRTYSQNKQKDTEAQKQVAERQAIAELEAKGGEDWAKYNSTDSLAVKQELLKGALPAYKEVTDQAQAWGMGGSSSRALNAVTIAITSALGGQTDLQAASNALAPYAAQFIGEQWGHGEDKNTAAQMVGHAILGATLAYINGGDPTAGGSAAVASEAAANYLTNQYKDKKEYQDANGVFQPNLLPEDVKAQIRDLTAGIGAVIGGAVGDSSYNAQLAGVIGKNAVENNNTAFVANPLEFEELQQLKTREEILLEAYAQKEQALYLALALNVVKDFILYRNFSGKYEVRSKTTGKSIATFDNEKDAQKAIDFAKLKVEQSKQNKHIPGTNEYKVAVSNDKTKSILSVDPNSLTKKLGTGQQVNNVKIGLPGSKERIDFGKVIGTYIDPKTGEKLPTNKGIVHYSNKGVHIVPSRP